MHSQCLNASARARALLLDTPTSDENIGQAIWPDWPERLLRPWNKIILFICTFVHVHVGHQISRIILVKQLRVEGFIVTRWFDQWPLAFKEMAQWIQEVCA